MVIDSSALIAIIENEPERRPFEQSIRMATTRLLGAASLFETSIVVLSRRREEGLAVLNEVLGDMRVETVPLSADHARTCPRRAPDQPHPHPHPHCRRRAAGRRRILSAGAERQIVVVPFRRTL